MHSLFFGFELEIRPQLSAAPDHTLESCRWFGRHKDMKEHTHIMGENVLIDQIVSVDD